MTYQLIQQQIVVATDKKWLKRHEYHSMAIKLYGILAKQQEPLDLSDVTLAKLCTTNLTSLKEAKRQLVYSGLLEVHKINSTTIVMVLGDKAIRKYHHRIKAQEHSRILRKTLENMHYPDIPTPIEEDESTSVYSQEDLESLYKEIPRPSPINSIDVLP